MKKKDLEIEEITYGECPKEITISFSKPVRYLDLHKIIIQDIKTPNIVTGLKIVAVEAS